PCASCSSWRRHNAAYHIAYNRDYSPDPLTMDRSTRYKESEPMLRIRQPIRGRRREIRDRSTTGVSGILLLDDRRGADEDRSQQAFLPRSGASGARQRTSRAEPYAGRAVAVRRQPDRGVAPESCDAHGTEGTRMAFPRAVNPGGKKCGSTRMEIRAHGVGLAVRLRCR